MDCSNARISLLPFFVGFLAVLLAMCAFAPDSALAVTSKSGKTTASAPMKGTSVLIVGDSIQDASCYKTYGAFIQRTVKSLGAKKIVNRAKKGAPIANVDECCTYSVYAQVMKEYKAGRLGKFDYYLIAGGTNDYGGGYKGTGRAALGDIYSDNVSTTCGALNKIITLIQKERKRVKGKEAHIIVVTPIGRYSYIRSFDRDCESVRNWVAKKTLADYRNLIADTAAQHEGVVVVDGLSLAGTAHMVSAKNSYEGLHPRVGFVKKRIVKKFKAQMKSILKEIAAEEAAARSKKVVDMRKYVKLR